MESSQQQDGQQQDGQQQQQEQNPMEVATMLHRQHHQQQQRQQPPAPPFALDPMMATELEYRADLLTRIFTNCYDRCAATQLPDGRLTIGENACIDRCSKKYMQVVDIVGQLIGIGRPE